MSSTITKKQYNAPKIVKIRTANTTILAGSLEEAVTAEADAKKSSPLWDDDDDYYPEDLEAEEGGQSLFRKYSVDF